MVDCIVLADIRADNLTQLKTATAMSKEITGYGFANKAQTKAFFAKHLPEVLIQ